MLRDFLNFLSEGATKRKVTAGKNVGVSVEVSQLGLQEDEALHMNTRL